MRRVWNALKSMGGAGLPANVRGLGKVSLANDAASDMIVPLLPLFVTQVLGLGPAFLGTLEGIAESTASLLKLVAGWYSDRIRKRKAFAVFGYGLSNLARPLIGLAAAGWHVLLLRFLDRVGKGIRTSPRDALLVEDVAEGERGRAFGYQRAMDNLGAAIGPLLAAGLLLFLDLRTVFIVSVIPGLFVMWVLVFNVRERAAAAPEPAIAPAIRGGGGSPLAGGLPTGKFRAYLLAVVLFTLGNSSDMFLVLRAQDLHVRTALIPILWMVLGLVRALAGTWGGALSDRIGRRQAIVLGWAVYGLCYLGFAAADQAWHVWALFVIYGLHYALVEGAERALVADLVPAAERGRAYGWFHLSVGIGALPASVVFGLIWKFGGPAWAFGFGALMALAATAALLRVRNLRAAV